jgi:IS30 family transposase
MSKQHLTYGERSTIATLKSKNRSITYIAEVLNRSVSSISREISRNSNPDGSYQAAAANQRAAIRSASASCRHSRIEPERWKYVDQALTQGQWSPEQIRNHMKFAGLKRISHEAIYQHILRDKEKGGSLHHEMRHKIRSYRRRGAPRERRGRIPNQRMIETRPPIIEQRLRFGDYELDTVIGRPSGEVLVTIVERRSRHTLMLKASDKSAIAVTAAIITALTPYKGKIHTLTYDNGKEFTNHLLIDDVLGSTGYFANPYRSWERGLNENTNGLIRQYFPKRTDFAEVSAEQIQEVQEKLNGRPRKCLGWRTPNQILFNEDAIVALPG